MLTLGFTTVSFPEDPNFNGESLKIRYFVEHPNSLFFVRNELVQFAGLTKLKSNARYPNWEYRSSPRNRFFLGTGYELFSKDTLCITIPLAIKVLDCFYRNKKNAECNKLAEWLKTQFPNALPLPKDILHQLSFKQKPEPLLGKRRPTARKFLRRLRCSRSASNGESAQNNNSVSSESETEGDDETFSRSASPSLSPLRSHDNIGEPFVDSNFEEDQDLVDDCRKTKLGTLLDFFERSLVKCVAHHEPKLRKMLQDDPLWETFVKFHGTFDFVDLSTKMPPWDRCVVASSGLVSKMLTLPNDSSELDSCEREDLAMFATEFLLRFNSNNRQNIDLDLLRAYQRLAAQEIWIQGTQENRSSTDTSLAMTLAPTPVNTDPPQNVVGKSWFQAQKNLDTVWSEMWFNFTDEIRAESDFEIQFGKLLDFPPSLDLNLFVDKSQGILSLSKNPSQTGDLRLSEMDSLNILQYRLEELYKTSSFSSLLNHLHFYTPQNNIQ